MNSCAAPSVQCTLQNEVTFSGIGLHTGKEASVRLVPATYDVGIVFRRVDIEGSPVIPATVEYVQATPRSTNLGIGDITICTVEHLLAAIYACGIDNLYIDIFGGEVPACGGNSETFIKLIQEGQPSCQCVRKEQYVCLEQPIYFSSGETTLIALPDDQYRISCLIDYPTVPSIGTQYYSVTINTQNFIEEISSCRTFCCYEEVEPLLKGGLIKGGSLDNAIVAKGDTILTNKKLKFNNEMVRHKILDLVGDLSLVGLRFCAHIIAIRSGHSANVAFAKQIFNHIKNL